MIIHIIINYLIWDNILNLKKLANEEIVKKMKHKFSIINFNERVSNYLKTRFNLDSDEQLYSIFEPKLITITFGKKRC